MTLGTAEQFISFRLTNVDGATVSLREAIDAVLAGTAPTTGETEPKGCTIKWR